MPVKVYLSKAGQVLLTNLQVTPTGSKLRHVRLPAQNYSNVTVDLTVGQSGSGDLTVAADVGDNGSVDWTWSGSATYPQALTTDNLATAVNAYLQGQTGEVDVPIRFYVSPFLDLSLQDVAATPTAQPDVSIGTSDIAFSPATPTEGDEVTVTATLHNLGGLASGPLTASFFATCRAGRNGTSAATSFPQFPRVPPAPLPSSGTRWASPATSRCGWWSIRTTGWRRPTRTTTRPCKPITILTRPDLKITTIDLSDDEPVVGETVDVALTLRNSGQTAAPASTLALYDGMPDSGGSADLRADACRARQRHGTATCTWTPATPGLHRLLAVGDRDGAVNESDEGNNDTWRDVYVGFRRADPAGQRQRAGRSGLHAGNAATAMWTRASPMCQSTCGGGSRPKKPCAAIPAAGSSTASTICCPATSITWT